MYLNIIYKILNLRAINVYLRMKKYLLLLGMVLLVSHSMYGQIFIQNTLYPYNRFVYNPAAAGVSGETTLTLMGRLQWLGIDGAPRLLTASLDAPLDGIDSGIGAYIIRDELGPLSTTGLNFAYSYRMSLGKGTLSAGVSGGILQKALDGDFIYNLDNGEDPLIPSGAFSASQVVPGLAAGLYYSHPNADGDELFYAGISGQDLLEPSIDDLTLSPGTGAISRVARSYYLLGGVNIPITSDVILHPSFATRTDGNSYQLDGSMHVSFKSFLLGASYRTISNESVSGIVGARLSDQLFFAYAYDFVLSDLNAQSDLSSHELVISYTLQGSGVKRRFDDVIKKTW